MLVHIEGEVPFGELLRWRLDRTAWAGGTTQLRQTRGYDRPYLAWETVRLVRNPYFDQGTGFEGYFVGTCQSSDQALEQVLGVGHQALVSMTRLYRYQSSYLRLLMRTLEGNSTDLRAIGEWSIQLGAILARLRCNVSRSIDAAVFRRETYRQVEGLPPIYYHEDARVVQHAYAIRGEEKLLQRLFVDPRHLRTSDQEAWATAQALGKFGHPLVRRLVASGPLR